MTIDFDINAQQRDVPNIRPLRIWVDHVLTDDKGNYKEVEYVEWAKIGSNGATTVDRIAILSKSKEGRVNPVWSVVKPHYEAWKQGQEDPTEGTPLDTWPAVTKGQVEQLKFLNIRSVEDVANANDATMERMGMGARVTRDKARAFIAAKQGQSVIAEQLSQRDTEITALKAQVAELTDAVKSLAADRPKRGRPPNVAEG